MTVTEAAGRLGISRQTLHKILAERSPVTAEMALRLGKFCGNGPGLWLRLQQQVDLWEVNEAFAAVTMAAMDEFKLPHEIVNVHGGACALGHPIGASGARIVVTLLGALRKQGQRRGVAALCIGGGEATALAVELM